MGTKAESTMGQDLRVPVVIVTGFLGAGKTTLVNYLLEAQPEKRLAVVLNDFGEIYIDTHLVVGARGGLRGLAHGCICCSIAASFREALLDILEGPVCPEKILVETSGVAYPSNVAAQLLTPGLRDQVVLESVIAVVEAEHAKSLAGRIAGLAERQIQEADILLLNKVDQVDPRTVAFTRSWLQGLNPSAEVVESTFTRVALDRLLPSRQPPSLALLGTTMRADNVITKEPIPTEPHERLLDVWSYSSPMPASEEKLRRVLHAMPETVYRAKGFLYLAEEPAVRKILQKVGDHVTISEGGSWSGTPQTWIVFIGSRASHDHAQMEAELETCGVW